MPGYLTVLKAGSSFMFTVSLLPAVKILGTDRTLGFLPEIYE